MGFKVSYAGLRCGLKDASEALGLTLGPQLEGGLFDLSWIADRPNSEWTLVRMEYPDWVSRNENLLCDLSSRFEIVACEVHEGVMYSAVQCWKAGRRVWKVSHTGSQGDVFNLDASGDLPAAFSVIRDTQVAAQNAEAEPTACDHMFEVPLSLVEAVLDFRHDVVFERNEFRDIFEIQRPAKPSLFSRMIGRVLR
ncbi:hypothetical protein [Roseibium sediminis]|uniref:hypothetical protein n=1 Tax=Roseibium sediminis TaxID=1775174 RepID=UPI00123D305A|nr:hypothetical protein [Roseibium sediminis]